MKKTLTFLLLTFLTLNLMSQSTTKDKIRPALLVIDVQNAYYKSMDQSDIEKPVRLINGYVDYFKSLEIPIIYIYHQDKKYGPPTDSKEFQFIDEIVVPEDAIKVTKHYGNAFNQTDLDEKLKELDCNTLFICGLSATGCVMATSVGAMDNDYNFFWIEGATMSPNKENTKVMEDVFETIGFTAIKAIVE